MSAGMAVWHWLSVNGLAILVVTYCCALVFTALLAALGLGVARRVARLAAESKRQAALLERLKAEIGTLTTPAEPRPVSAGPPDKPLVPDFPTLDALRQELAKLKAELPTLDGDPGGADVGEAASPRPSADGSLNAAATGET